MPGSLPISTTISDELISRAFAGVFSRQEAKLLALLRGRQCPLQIKQTVWRRLSKGLADWQAFSIRETLRLDFALMGDIPYLVLDATELQQLMRSLDSRAAVVAFRDSLVGRSRTRDVAASMTFYIKTVLSSSKGILCLAIRQSKGMTLVDRMCAWRVLTNKSRSHWRISASISPTPQRPQKRLPWLLFNNYNELHPSRLCGGRPVLIVVEKPHGSYMLCASLNRAFLSNLSKRT